jgi:septum formation protein
VPAKPATAMDRLVLASASPQRRAILAQVGIPFVVRPAGVDEVEAGEPREVAEENARRKALAVTSALTLGADTVVALGAELFGKPGHVGEAGAFLSRLSGRTHEVVGGIALAADGAVVCAAVEVTRVRFRSLSPALVDWYLSTEEWRERAGGYAIQGAGAALVAGIEGDYLNVVGLPLARLLDLRPDLLRSRP